MVAPVYSANPWIRPIVSIGAGGIVRDAHLPAYKIAGFPVSSIFDIDAEKATKLARDFRIPRVYSSLQEIVREAPKDSVFDVAVPASALPDTLSALPIASAVLMQKPMGGDLDDARAILNICRRRKLQAAVNFQLRYAPNIVAARDLISSGSIGEVHDMEVRVTVYTPWHLWSFLRGIPRVEILYHSIHYVDLIRSFFGEPRDVLAKSVRHPNTARLEATRTAMLLDYGEWKRATITTNHGHNFGPRHQESYVKWEGTHGAIKARLGVLLNYPSGRPDNLEVCTRPASNSKTVPKWRRVPVAGNWFPRAFIGTMASVMKFAGGASADLPTRVEDAFNTMAVVEAAYKSCATGGVRPSLFS
jgi:predicted dehydrogenase